MIFEDYLQELERAQTDIKTLFNLLECVKILFIN